MLVQSSIFGEYPLGTHWTPGEVRAVALPDGFELAEPVSVPVDPAPSPSADEESP